MSFFSLSFITFLLLTGKNSYNWLFFLSTKKLKRGRIGRVIHQIHVFHYTAWFLASSAVGRRHVTLCSQWNAGQSCIHFQAGRQISPALSAPLWQPKVMELQDEKSWALHPCLYLQPILPFMHYLYAMLSVLKQNFRNSLLPPIYHIFTLFSIWTRLYFLRLWKTILISISDCSTPSFYFAKFLKKCFDFLCSILSCSLLDHFSLAFTLLSLPHQ